MSAEIAAALIGAGATLFSMAGGAIVWLFKLAQRTGTLEKRFDDCQKARDQRTQHYDILHATVSSKLDNLLERVGELTGEMRRMNGRAKR